MNSDQKAAMTPAQTDTPRVDAEFKYSSPIGLEFVTAIFARQLERDLSHAVKVAGEARVALANLLDDMTERAKSLADYNDKPVELPIGNGVLHEAMESLKALSELQRIAKP